jgi:hypothetical protein
VKCSATHCHLSREFETNEHFVRFQYKMVGQWVVSLQVSTYENKIEIKISSISW